jgi:hypothetical protein
MSDQLDASIKEHLGQTRQLPAGLAQKAKDLVPGKSSKSVPCPHCGKAITPFKKSPASIEAWLWLAAAAMAFAASFMVPRYFMQFLAVTLLCGFKAITDLRARKTQVLIYKALQDEEVPARGRGHHSGSRL